MATAQQQLNKARALVKGWATPEQAARQVKAEAKMADNQKTAPTPQPVKTPEIKAPEQQRVVPKPQDALPQQQVALPQRDGSTVRQQPPVTPQPTQPIFRQRQVQKDLEAFSTQDDLVKWFASGQLNKQHLKFLRDSGDDRFSQVESATKNKEIMDDVKKFRENLVQAWTSTQQEEAKVVSSANPFQTELNNLVAASDQFFSGLRESADSNFTTFSAQDLYDQTVNTDEITEKRTEANAIALEIDELQQEIQKIEEDVREQFPSDMPEWAIRREVVKRTNALMEQENLLQSRYRTAVADLDGLEKDAQVQFNLAVQDAQRIEDQQWKQRQLQYDISKEQFQTQRNLATTGLEMAEKEYWRQKDMEDKIAIAQMEDTMKKDFITWQYETERAYAPSETPKTAVIDVDWVKNLVNMESWEVINTFNQQIMNYSPSSSDLTSKTLVYWEEWFRDREIVLAQPAMAAFEAANAEFREKYGRDIKIWAEATSSYRTPDQQAALYGRGRTEQELLQAGLSKTKAKKYAAPDANIVTYTLNQSKHQKWLAIDLLDIEEVEKAMPFLEKYGMMQASHGFGDYVNFEFQGNLNTAGMQQGIAWSPNRPVKNTAEAAFGGNVSFYQEDITAAANSIAQGLPKFQAELLLSNVEYWTKKGNKTELRKNIENWFIQSLSNSEETVFRDRRQFISDMNLLKGKINEFVGNWWELGVFTGAEEDILQRVWKTQWADVAKLNAIATDILDILARDRTGAALTESEENFYWRLLPWINKTSELNIALIDGLIETAENRTTGMVQSNLESIISDDVFALLYWDTEVARNMTWVVGVGAQLYRDSRKSSGLDPITEDDTIDVDVSQFMTIPWINFTPIGWLWQ